MLLGGEQGRTTSSGRVFDTDESIGYDGFMSEEKLEKILATVVYLKDKIDNEMVTQIQLEEKTSQVLTHIDGFIKLHETLDQELVSLRHKYDRLESRIKTVETKLGIESK